MSTLPPRTRQQKPQSIPPGSPPILPGNPNFPSQPPVVSGTLPAQKPMMSPGGPIMPPKAPMMPPAPGAEPALEHPPKEINYAARKAKKRAIEGMGSQMEPMMPSAMPEMTPPESMGGGEDMRARKRRMIEGGGR